MKNDFFPIFIPSYHRANNCKTAHFFIEQVGWPSDKIHIFIDSEADDSAAYERLCKRLKCNLHIFDMNEARRRFDYVHRASVSRRSAGQARNMFHDFAIKNNIDFFMVQDDDTQNYWERWLGIERVCPVEIVKKSFLLVRDFMTKRKIGLFGLSQQGEIMGITDTKLLRKKVMNTTFYLMPYVYRGEKGVQNNDTSQFVNALNEGYFTGSFRYGVVLMQMASATQKGGLTDLYKECKLLNKGLVPAIQFPSAIRCEKQKSNGGRLHHKINYRYLAPCILKNEGGRSNIAWDTYPEDVPFSCEPKQRNYVLN